MVQPEEWIVGLRLSDGTDTVFSGDAGVDPSTIEEVVFPLSIPWLDGPQLYSRVLREVATEERDMGPEIQYSARIEDTVPNSDEIWEVELEIWEYPRGALNMARMEHTDHVTSAIWDSDDLLNAM